MVVFAISASRETHTKKDNNEQTFWSVASSFSPVYRNEIGYFG